MSDCNISREYQIRIIDNFGEEEVFHFTDVCEARAKYWEIHQARLYGNEDNCYTMELVEVLDQATVQPTNSSSDL